MIDPATAVQRAFDFLIAMGFHQAEARFDRLRGGGSFAWESDLVRVEVWLDVRGELDLTLRRRDSSGPGTYLRALAAPNRRPFDLKPPVIFASPKLAQATNLLAGMTQRYAMEVLQGSSAALSVAAAASDVDVPTPLEKASGWVGTSLDFVESFDTQYGITRDTAGQVTEATKQLPSPGLL